MKITQEQQNKMLETAKPLIKWMNENCHPHCTASVDQNTVELLEGIAHSRTDEFLADLHEGVLPDMPFIKRRAQEGLLAFNGNEIVFTSSPNVGVAGIAEGQPDEFARELVKRWNAFCPNPPRNASDDCL